MLRWLILIFLFPCSFTLSTAAFAETDDELQAESEILQDADDLRDHNWCGDYDYDPRLCNSQSGCEYDSYYRRCVERQEPFPGQQCQYYRDPRSCASAPGCYWDRGWNTCAEDPLNPDPSPGPGPGRTVTRTITCISDEYRAERCPVGGRIVSVYISRQHSRRACSLNQTWGDDGYAIWVDNGCRADFVVTYYQRW
jgi:hypothetical protein